MFVFEIYVFFSYLVYDDTVKILTENFLFSLYFSCLLAHRITREITAKVKENCVVC